MDIIKTLAAEFNIKNTQVEQTIELIDEGNTIPFSTGQQRVYIESNDLWTWNCGLEKSTTWSGDEYSVTMQYRYATGGTEGKLVNVRVTFSVTGDGGWWW